MNFDRICALILTAVAGTSLGAVILTKRKYEEERNREKER